jgi:hypothetical protein
MEAAVSQPRVRMGVKPATRLRRGREKVFIVVPEYF